MRSIIWSRDMETYLRENYVDKSALRVAIDLSRWTEQLVTANDVKKKISSLGLTSNDAKPPKLVRCFRINGDEIPYSYSSIEICDAKKYIVALLVEPYWIVCDDSLAKASRLLREKYAKWTRSKWRGKPRK